ncbi:MAG: aldehyde dehydrogenase (NADP(+)), partial [Sphingopyxis sp.]
MNGSILVGGAERSRLPFFHGVNPATGAALPMAFSTANAADVADACGLAADAAEGFGALLPDERAAFLERIAD